jgi:hypothetical protein
VKLQGIASSALYWPADEVGSQTPGRLRPGDLSLRYTSCHIPSICFGRSPPRSCLVSYANSLFAWLISHQPAVLFSHNKPATSNQPAVLFSQNKPAPAISHQPNEQAASLEVVADQVIWGIFWKVFRRSCGPPTRSVGPTDRSAGLLVGRTHLSGTAVSLVGGDPGVPMSHTSALFKYDLKN